MGEFEPRGEHLRMLAEAQKRRYAVTPVEILSACGLGPHEWARASYTPGFLDWWAAERAKFFVVGTT